MPFRGRPLSAMPEEVQKEARRKITEGRLHSPGWLAFVERMKVDRLGFNNPNWKGSKVKRISANARARRNYILSHPCELCGNTRTERHHKNDNPWNNASNNIQWLCRRCHMIVDGRMNSLLKMNHNRFK